MTPLPTRAHLAICLSWSVVRRLLDCKLEHSGIRKQRIVSVVVPSELRQIAPPCSGHECKHESADVTMSTNEMIVRSVWT